MSILDLGSPLWGGISAIATILGLALAVAHSTRTHRRDVEQAEEAPSAPSTPSIGARVGGAMLVWFAVLVLWGCTWAALAFAFGQHPMMFLATPLIVIGSLAAWGALATKVPVVGGFLGGGVPFGVFALWVYAELSQLGQPPEPALPLAWFAFFLLFGGLLGAIVAVIAITGVRRLGIPLPRH